MADDYDPLEVVLEALHAHDCVVVERNGKAMATCPAHEDNTPSLSITTGADGRALLYCFGGCDTTAVLEALELSESQLFADGDTWEPDPENRYEIPTVPDDPQSKLYVYRDAKGNKVAWHRRHIEDGKKKRASGHFNGKGQAIASVPEDLVIPLYNADVIEDATDTDVVWVAEGERDADNLHKHLTIAWNAPHIPVTTTFGGAATHLRAEWIDPLRKFDRVFVVVDKGEAGWKRGLAWLQTDLPVTIHEPTLGDDWSDHQSNMGTIGELRRLTAEDLAGRIEGPLEPISVLEDVPVPLLNEDALYGVLGRMAVTLHNYTGLDVVALYLTLINVVGNLIGWQVWTQLDAGPIQHTQGGVVIVGPSGDGKDRVVTAVLEHVAAKIDPTWRAENVNENVQSSQVLVHLVRDDTTKITIDKKTGQPITNVIPGVADTRVLILEREFSRIIKDMQKPQSTMSEICRTTFDSTYLQNKAKGETLDERSTRCHMSWIGLITPNDFDRYVSENEIANGLLNRFTLTLLVNGEPTVQGDLAAALKADLTELQEALDEIHDPKGPVGLIKLAPVVEEHLRRLDRGVRQYLRMSRGLAGTMEARYMPHVMRWAMVFALVDQSPWVEWQHFAAAVHLRWYGAECNHVLLGGKTGSTDADEIRQLLKRNHPEATSKTDIWTEFQRHTSSVRINAALRTLEYQGIATGFKGQATGKAGRIPELWKLTPTGLQAGGISSLLSLLPYGLRSLLDPTAVTNATRIGESTDPLNPIVAVPSGRTPSKRAKEANKSPVPDVPSVNGTKPRRRIRKTVSWDNIPTPPPPPEDPSYDGL